MSKLVALMRNAPKRTSALFAAFAVAIVAPLAVQAWGPDRPTYTYQNPAPHVTFNSMNNAPNYGDERNFVRIKESGAANNAYTDQVNLQAGKQYTVMVYYHNNASSTLNDAAHDYKGVALNAKMRVQMPATVLAGDKARITGFVSADNAQPGTVWDEVYATASSNVALRYVPNSATIYSNGAVDGQKMPDSLYTTGANLGYNSLDGKLPGCNEFAGWVTYNIVVDQPNFEVTKQVAKKGSTDWKDSINAMPGEEVDYRIHYKNTGTTVQNDVVIKDTLPTGVTYVAGSTFVSNGASNFQWKATTNNEVTKGGLNIGNYAAGAGAYVKFTAKLPAKESLATCGPNTLVNKASAQTNNGTKSDEANVVITKDCVPPAKYTCNALTVATISRTEFRFSTAYTVENGTFKGVTYVVRNAAGTVVDTINATTNTTTYNQTKAGPYTVQATVHFTVNGETKSATSDACKAAFTVKDLPKEITVCELGPKKIITIKETEFDPSKHSKNPEDCKETPIKVCDLTTKVVVTINEKDFDTTKYSKDLSKCETPVVPETPSELPQTGAGENIVAIVGLGAMIASIAYYVASRRAVNQ